MLRINHEQNFLTQPTGIRWNYVSAWKLDHQARRKRREQNAWSRLAQYCPVSLVTENYIGSASFAKHRTPSSCQWLLAPLSVGMISTRCMQSMEKCFRANGGSRDLCPLTCRWLLFGGQTSEVYLEDPIDFNSRSVQSFMRSDNWCRLTAAPTPKATSTTPTESDDANDKVLFSWTLWLFMDSARTRRFNKLHIRWLFYIVPANMPFVVANQL